MVGDSASPLMLRRRLRNELRAARLDKGLTQEQVAKAMEWSLSKMNRIEKAKTGISANDLKALLPLYGITDEERTEELLALARAARQAPWWRGYSDVAPATLLELIDYESAASAISQFEPMFVPGILQTEEYAPAVLQAFYGEGSPTSACRPGRAPDQAPGPADQRGRADVLLRARRVRHPPSGRRSGHHEPPAQAPGRPGRPAERDDTGGARSRPACIPG